MPIATPRRFLPALALAGLSPCPADDFDHHLKGAPAPEWMTAGVQFLDRDREARP